MRSGDRIPDKVLVEKGKFTKEEFLETARVVDRQIERERKREV
jgi:hypothetical protein